MSDQATRLAGQLRAHADLIEAGEIPVGPDDVLVTLPAPPAIADKLIDLARRGRPAPAPRALGGGDAAVTLIDQLREAYELADFEVDRAVFVDGADELTVRMLEQDRDAAEHRLDAVLSQQPDRRPFTGRLR